MIIINEIYNLVIYIKFNFFIYQIKSINKVKVIKF